MRHTIGNHALPATHSSAAAEFSSDLAESYPHTAEFSSDPAEFDPNRVAKRLGALAAMALSSALIFGGCVVDPDDDQVQTANEDVAGSCSTERGRFGVHVGGYLYGERQAVLSQVDAGWVRMLHQFKRCNDRLPAHCPQTSAWNCDAGNGVQNDLESYVTQIKDYQNAGLKVLLNVNGWAIPACVEESASHPPPAPTNLNDAFAANWLYQYTTELTRLVDYLRIKGALPDAIQVGNEPNGIEEMHCGFFGSMLFAADGILRTKATGVQRVVGGVINPFPHQMGGECLSQAVYQAKEAWKSGHPNQNVPNDYISYHGVSVHMYGIRGDDNYRVDDDGTIVRQRWDGAIDSLAMIRTQFGPSPKMWITETGGPLNEGASSETSENYKARFLEYTLPHLAANSDVERVFVYRLVSGGEHLGLFSADGATANGAVDEVNAAVCGHIDPNNSGGTPAQCSSNGWCKCPNDASTWYEEGATGSNSQAVRCDGEQPPAGPACNEGWCPCPDDPNTWYEQNPTTPNQSQAVKCDGQSVGGGDAECNNGWCRCPDDPDTWYDESAASGSNSQAEACTDGAVCNNGWCQCPDDPDTWYDPTQTTGLQSQAVKCG